MPSGVEDAHRTLHTFCNDNAGIGISKDLLLHLLRAHIERSQVYLRGLPSNQRFKHLDASFQIFFDVTLEAPGLDIHLRRNDGKSPIVEVNRIKSKLAASIEGYRICNIDIEFTNLIARLLLVDKQLKLNLISHTATETNFQKLWETNQSTKSEFERQYKFDDEAWDRLTHHFKAISLITTYEIADSFLESVVFPDIFSVFRGIVFGDDGFFGSKRRPRSVYVFSVFFVELWSMSG